MFRKYPGLVLLTMVAAGIVLADQFRLPGWVFLFLCFITGLAGILVLQQRHLGKSMVLFGLGLFFFAGYHFSVKCYDFGPNHVSRIVSERKTYQIFAKVVDWPDIKENRTEIKIALDSLGLIQNMPVKGNILLKISEPTSALQRGDRLEFKGTIYPLKTKSDPGEFDYARYLQLQGIFGIVYQTGLLDVRVDKSRRFGIIGTVDQIRDYLSDSFSRNLTPVSAAMAAGILIGETRDIPNELYNKFRDSGTLHLLAVSGSNVALVILFMLLVLRPFSIKKKRRAFILVMAVFLFALLSYGEPSVVRASLMAVLVLIATMIERKFDLNQIIATAALIILLFDPAELFNVGFQLSFVTAWGLIFIVPKVSDLFKPHQNKYWFRWLALPLIVSLVAQISSMPLIAYYFDKIPAVSVAANIVIVPLISVAVVASLLLVVINLIWPMLALFFGSLLDSFMKVVISLLNFFGGENSILISTANMSGPLIFLAYIILVISVASLTSKHLRRVAVGLVILIINFGLVYTVIGNSTTDSDKIYFDVFNIPGGTAVLVHHSNKGAPDLIITGIDARDYPIDDLIFRPSLSSLKVENISRIFVISAEYGAIDDILRLAAEFDSRMVIVDKRLFNSFEDCKKSFGKIESPAKISTFPGRIANDIGPGLYPFSNSVLVKLESSSVLVANDLSQIEQVGEMSIKSTGLILSNLSKGVSDLSYLQNVSHIICSKSNQALSAINSIKSVPKLHVIEDKGPCRLYVPKDNSKSFDIQTIQ